MRWLSLLLIVLAVSHGRAQHASGAEAGEPDNIGFNDGQASNAAFNVPPAATMTALTGDSIPKKADESDADVFVPPVPAYTPTALPSPNAPKFLSSDAEEVDASDQSATTSHAQSSDQQTGAANAESASDSETDGGADTDSAAKTDFVLHRLAAAVSDAASSSPSSSSGSSSPLPASGVVLGQLQMVNSTLYAVINGNLVQTPDDMVLKLNDTVVTFVNGNLTVKVTNGYQAQYSDGVHVLVIGGEAIPIVKGSNDTKVTRTPLGLVVTVKGTAYAIDKINNFVLIVDGHRTLVINATVLNETLVPTKPVASWVPTFLTPTPSLSLASTLYVWIPNNMTNALRVKHYQVRHLLGRIKEIEVEISRLARQFIDSEKLMDDHLSAQLVMQRNFHHLYRQHEKATRGPTIDDRKESLVTQLPLLEEARHILTQQSKQLALVSAWSSGSKLNVDMRVALYRNLIRLQREVGILALEATMLPLS